MHVPTHGNRGIHFKQIGLGLQHLSTTLQDPQRLLFGKTTFAIEMLLEELKIRLRPIVWGEELVLRWGVESWCLNICGEVVP